MDIPGQTDITGLTVTQEAAPLTTNVLNPVSAADVQKLAPILVVAQNLHAATEGTAPTILSELSSGLIRVGALTASARYQVDKARIDRKKIAGVLSLEEYPKYLVEKGVKGTEALREAFIDSHDKMVEASEREAYADALVVQLDVIKSTLIMSLSSVKSIVYGFKDSNSVTGNRV